MLIDSVPPAVRLSSFDYQPCRHKYPLLLDCTFIPVKIVRHLPSVRAGRMKFGSSFTIRVHDDSFSFSFSGRMATWSAQVRTRCLLNHAFRIEDQGDTPIPQDRGPGNRLHVSIEPAKAFDDGLAIAQHLVYCQTTSPLAGFDDHNLLDFGPFTLYVKMLAE